MSDSTYDSDTPILDYLHDVFESTIIPIPGEDGAGIVEDIWLCVMVMDLRERYRDSGII